ncbi:MAG TPA: hypothetical protein VNO81_14035 [Candidatus Nitrosotenuis sp.]|nr:hypothetical protein [Candidatus Nitrosotenuis sp.]
MSVSDIDNRIRDIDWECGELLNNLQELDRESQALREQSRRMEAIYGCHSEIADLVAATKIVHHEIRMESTKERIFDLLDERLEKELYRRALVSEQHSVTWSEALAGLDLDRRLARLAEERKARRRALEAAKEQLKQNSLTIQPRVAEVLAEFRERRRIGMDNRTADPQKAKHKQFVSE